jgi:hypothetical protein
MTGAAKHEPPQCFPGKVPPRRFLATPTPHPAPARGAKKWGRAWLRTPSPSRPLSGARPPMFLNVRRRCPGINERPETIALSEKNDWVRGKTRKNGRRSNGKIAGGGGSPGDLNLSRSPRLFISRARPRVSPAPAAGAQMR